MKLTFALLKVILISVLSMSNNIWANDGPEQKEVEQYLLHAESSERLFNIMQQISSVADAQEGSQNIRFTEDDMDDLLEAVEELLFYAELMTQKVPASQLEESNNVIFSAMASKLYDETLNLQQLSNSYDLHATDYAQEILLHDAFTRLSQTCNACHELFRDF